MLSYRFEKLDAIERVRAALKDVVGEKLTVPGIIVVGAQSSGKSSVLEHATGLAFPRGEGTCTRVPTTVSVECVPDCEATGVTCATDAAYENDRHELAADDADGFAAAIRKLTDELAPSGAISDRSIYVKYRKHGAGPTFTLTDCPGITCLSKTQLDIEKTTTDLTRSMIAANDETLVLVVLPATEAVERWEGPVEPRVSVPLGVTLVVLKLRDLVLLFFQSALDPESEQSMLFLERCYF